MRTSAIIVLAAIGMGDSLVRGASSDAAAVEGQYLSNVRQAVFAGRRAGEGYFNADGTRMVFQSERESDNPFYQIYVMDLLTGDTVRVSPGVGKTTCAWLHPDNRRVMFSSTHEDANARDKQTAELELRAAGKSKRYKFEYDPYYEIYEARADGSGEYRNLTSAFGYDAEGSYSPDGTKIAFASNRHAYAATLEPVDRDKLAQTPEYFLDIYIMNADGTGLKRLTDVRGYDGGPFFSPDGKRICWRRFTEDGARAEIWTMNIDGSDPRQLTRLAAMSWAPFYHPSGDYLIFTTNIHGFKNFELYIVDVAGEKTPVRVTDTDGFDGLPVFLPNGNQLAWTSTRTADGEAQIFFADWNDAAARESLGLRGAKPSQLRHACPAEWEMPATEGDVTATDLNARIEALAQAAQRASLVDAVAATFCNLGLDPAGERGTLFQFCDPAADGSAGTVSPGCNVVAKLPAGPSRTGRPLVIGCAVAPTTAEVSGAAAVLEIAEYLLHQQARSRKAWKRDVVFAVFVGDLANTESPVGALDKLLGYPAGEAAPFAAFIELDAVFGGSSTLTLSGVGSSPVWPREIERRNLIAGAAIEAHEAPSPMSFSFPLYLAGVPVLSIASAGSDQPGDNRGAAKGVRLAALMSRGLALADADPAFTLVAERRGAKSGFPYLGTEPDYRGKGPGVLLTGVADDGPAARAGVKAGDMIVSLADKPIKDIEGYARALDGLTIGEATTIEVVRNGKRLTLEVMPAARE